MAYLTANYLLTDSGGFGKKKPKQPIVPVSSNVQTPDLIAAKSQPTWENNVKTLAVKGKIMADAKKAEEENWGRDPLWTAPGISTNEKPFSTATAYGRENRDMRQEAETLGIDYDAVWQDGAEKARRSLMKQWNETNETIGEQSPTLGSVLSVGLLPMTVAGAVQMGVSGLLGRTVDPNSPAFQSVNARDALRDGATKRIAENHGEVWEKRYRDGMSAADAGYGALLAAGGLSGAVDIGSSAAGRYMELIRSGMTPEAAGKLAGVQAAVDALTEFLPADEALGAVVKKSGMMDTLMEWGRKIPAAEKLIQTVTDRTNAALHKLGMDLHDVDLPRDKQNEMVKLTEALYGFTDEETGRLIKDYTRNIELTRDAMDDNLIRDFQFFASPDKQFGKKAGKHAYDFGLDPSSEADRETLRGFIQNISDRATEQRIGEWRGYQDEVVFHILGDDVVITEQTGEFISILKGGIKNARVKNARKR